MSTQTRAIIDKLLTNVSNQLIPIGFIAEMILPALKVKQRTGKIGKLVIAILELSTLSILVRAATE